MCNCFSPTTLFPHSPSFSFGFTTSKLTHKSPPVFGSTPCSHRNLELGKSKRGIPKLSSSDGYDFFDDLWLKEEGETEIPVIEASKINKQAEIPSPRKGIDDEDDDRGVRFLELGREAEEIMKREVGEKLELEKGILRRKKQMMKRSNLIAKQVISIQSALSLGFVSQLWVDINSVRSTTLLLQTLLYYRGYIGFSCSAIQSLLSYLRKSSKSSNKTFS
ncbi:hypothetical protein AABB24_017557 [Solanum stoloniferum]|uniref:Uncharacterized protein n=1 Tax=Solanum stoloniferum TaxID=62892 RepID=A0ABD2TMB3_9SOLN